MTDININIDKTYNHWLDSSDTDFKAMIHLFESEDYHWALFIGHLVIEKLLKARLVKVTGYHAPFSHDLRRLAKNSEIEFDSDHIAWLDTITTFNLNARYDSYKQSFYKKCDSDFTAMWITNIKELREWIKEKL